jgi:hypothetical protein
MVVLATSALVAAFLCIYLHNPFGDKLEHFPPRTHLYLRLYKRPTSRAIILSCYIHQLRALQKYFHPT